MSPLESTCSGWTTRAALAVVQLAVIACSGQSSQQGGTPSAGNGGNTSSSASSAGASASNEANASTAPTSSATGTGGASGATGTGGASGASSEASSSGGASSTTTDASSSSAGGAGGAGGAGASSTDGATSTSGAGGDANQYQDSFESLSDCAVTSPCDIVVVNRGEAASVDVEATLCAMQALRDRTAGLYPASTNDNSAAGAQYRNERYLVAADGSVAYAGSYSSTGLFAGGNGGVSSSYGASRCTLKEPGYFQDCIDRVEEDSVAAYECGAAANWVTDCEPGPVSCEQ